MDLLSFETYYDAKVQDLIDSILQRNVEDRKKLKEKDMWIHRINSRIDSLEYAFLMSEDHVSKVVPAGKLKELETENEKAKAKNDKTS